MFTKVIEFFTNLPAAVAEVVAKTPAAVIEHDLYWLALPLAAAAYGFYRLATRD